MFAGKHHLKIGKEGEDLISRLLLNNHWQIIERNFRRKSDEIDIIARSPDQTIVFIEVKTILIWENAKLTPEDNLTRAKLKKISRTCEFFARENPLFINEDKGWRIDLFAVDMGQNGKPSAVRHYRNIA